MALSRLASILANSSLWPKELDPYDLLALSHVSTYWRTFVLSDKRWAEWFAIIVNYSDESFEQCLTALNILDSFSKRALVYRCLAEACTVCGGYAQQLFIPHMKRVCDTCLPGEEFSVISFSAALAKYDLRDRELRELLILEWLDPNRTSKRPVKVISEALAKKIAIRKYSTEALLTAHLEWKKTSARSQYTARSEDYRTAVSMRSALQEKGNIAEAEAVVLASTGRKIPAQFPPYPPILAQSTRKVDRKVACFAPQPLLVVGNTIVVDPCEDDGDDEE
ncbi:hypothetical protein B0H11DRAFT_2268431 [Mycena galericulata]|nr:hypothetical protein B0H11DRAFT_2268431 [Mycena galericulata]